jgi:hypothetical protein
MEPHILAWHERTTTSARVTDVRGGAVAIAVEIGTTTNEVQFKADVDIDADGAADATAAACLYPAMNEAADLQLVDAVSPRLLDSLESIQDIIRSWEQRRPVYRRYHRIHVDAPRRNAPAGPPPAGPVASFFTSGVDSFFTALRHRDEIDALVYVQGFDVRPGEHDLQDRVLTGVREAAAALGMPLIVCDTDLRVFADRHAGWEEYHGSALAFVAHMLSTRFHRVYIPATLTYAHLVPLGSHPLLDPLWSSERIEVVHDGAHLSRLEKLEAIIDEPAVQRHLRVCWENRDGAYNCGRCEKCLRTSLALLALGRLSDVDTLPSEIHTADVARVRLPEVTYTWDASLARLEATGTNPAVARAVRRRLYSRTLRAAHRSRYYAGRVKARLR